MSAFLQTYVRENAKSQNYSCGANGYFLDCKIWLKTDAGKHVGYSRLGSIIFSGKEIDPSQYTFYKLSSSGATRSWEYNLTKAFKFLAPGRYKLSLEATVSRHTGQEGGRGSTITLIADELPFQVQ